MPVRKANHNNNGVFFLTFTCTQWLPLFQITDGYKFVYKWFDYLKEQGHYVLGYVIMTNHVHCIIALRQTDKSLNIIVGNAKRFLSYAIVTRLEELNLDNIITLLKNGVNDTQKSMGKKHQVFEPSFDWKECLSLDFIKQKLDYIHLNPCKGDKPLVSNPQGYIHSSARYYLEGFHAGYIVADYMKMLDIDLSK